MELDRSATGPGTDCCRLSATALPPQRRKRLKLPTAHGQQQRVTFAVFVTQLLVSLVLLGKVLRHALHALHERWGQAAADRAMHQQQALTCTIKAA